MVHGAGDADPGAVLHGVLRLGPIEPDAAAQTTIRQAAAYKAEGGALVTPTGHTDRSGPEAYDLALSLRRANAVRDALVSEGVKASDISVVGLGEAQPLVPTPDGVREAQNRRVQIVRR